MVIYLDGSDLDLMKAYEARVSGFTTNPSLCKQAGIRDYKTFAAAVLLTTSKPVSFEVFSDDLEGMDKQAREIASWGENIYIKIPVTNTKGVSTAPLIKNLCDSGIKVNATAIFTHDQINLIGRMLRGPSILSIFCGRIADTGRDPVPFITHALNVKAHDTKVLWASTREVLNVKQAQACGADIITLTPGLLKKLDLFGKDLTLYSLETVSEFYEAGKGLML